MPTPNLTRDIGQAERAMRALLERLLDEAGLSFAEWTVLVFLDGAGTLTSDDLVRRQVDGRVATEAGARVAVDKLVRRGLLAPTDNAGEAGRTGVEDENPRLAPTAAGESVYLPVRGTVDRITGELYGDLPQDALEATHRTLAEVHRRANARLAAGGAEQDRPVVTTETRTVVVRGRLAPSSSTAAPYPSLERRRPVEFRSSPCT